MWVYPDPARLGLEVERDDQTRIARVDPGSPAAAAGLQPGDRIRTLDGAPILTRADVQWRLQQLPFAKCDVALLFERAGARRSATLALRRRLEGLRSVRVRVAALQVEPAAHPGFGGKLRRRTRMRALGLEPAQFAQRVGYLVTWGEKANSGRNAQAAGLRKDDVVPAIGGKSDFATRTTCRRGSGSRRRRQRVELVVLRDGERRTLRMKVVD
jgi:S1-C subfamily serine protease